MRRAEDALGRRALREAMLSKAQLRPPQVQRDVLHRGRPRLPPRVWKTSGLRLAQVLIARDGNLTLFYLANISHRCEDPCHRGNCHSCPHVSFDELSCHCGEQTLFPPVPCGTRPPECANRCARSHDCDHEVMHNCHSDERCPPCTALTERRCYGGHEVRILHQLFRKIVKRLCVTL